MGGLKSGGKKTSTFSLEHIQVDKLRGGFEQRHRVPNSVRTDGLWNFRATAASSGDAAPRFSLFYTSTCFVCFIVFFACFFFVFMHHFKVELKHRNILQALLVVYFNDEITVRNSLQALLSFLDINISIGGYKCIAPFRGPFFGGMMSHLYFELDAWVSLCLSSSLGQVGVDICAVSHVCIYIYI